MEIKSTHFTCVFVVILVSLHVTTSDITLGEVADTVGSLFGAVENCEFKCPGNSLPQPNPDYTPSSNGCGSFGVTVDLESMPGMTQCCNIHDYCYGRCNSDKSACDRDLRSCFNQICMRKEINGESGSQVKECYHYVHASSEILGSFVGCEAFENAQNEACVCEKERFKKRGKRSIFLADLLGQIQSKKA